MKGDYWNTFTEIQANNLRGKDKQTTSKKQRLRWKKRSKETGLKAVGENPNRPSDFHDGKTIYATVLPSGGNWIKPFEGWFFCGRIGSMRINTFDKLVPTEAEAKKNAEAWVKEAIKQKEVNA